MKPILPFILLACLSACSYGNGQSDAGVDAGDDGDAGEDRTDGGDPGDIDTRPDYDPSRSFLLFIPEGTSLCHSFCEGRTWRQALDLIGRIDLAPGYYILPRQNGFHPAELIAGVLFGPGQNQLRPVQSPMECQAKDQSQGDRWLWHYTCRKGYTFSGESYNLEVFILIWSETGNWPEEVTIDATDPSLVIHAKLYIGAGVDFMTEIQTSGPCELPGLGVHTATTASGHRVDLDMHRGFGCRIVGETVCASLTSAQVQMGTFQQAIYDRFRLVYVASHHNLYDEYLILLNPPAGSTHVVLVDAPDYMGSTGYVIQMDANFNEVSRDEITDWQYN